MKHLFYPQTDRQTRFFLSDSEHRSGADHQSAFPNLNLCVVKY